MNDKALITEIFSSVQGEGAYTGEKMTFVRFGKCSFGCKWCDTPQGRCPNQNFNVENPPSSGRFVKENNPVTITRLNDLMRSFQNPFISVTGGEPLEQADFLREWLPTQKEKKILLETNGVLPQNLQRIIDLIDIISMDIKLPSSTGCSPKWEQHKEFLNISNSSGKDLYVKIVVTESTTNIDVEKAIRLVNSVNKFIPLYIQPASQTLTFHEKISQEKLSSIERICSVYLPNVKIAPQMHKVWGIL